MAIRRTDETQVLSLGSLQLCSGGFRCGLRHRNSATVLVFLWCETVSAKIESNRIGLESNWTGSEFPASWRAGACRH